MVEHHLQKQILHTLVGVPCAHFAELKPADVEGNIFTYHLQQLIKQRYIEKKPDGTYCLTAAGKAVGINIQLSRQESLRQAHSIILMALHNPDKGWLLRRRLVHPTYGKIGFVHAEPVFEEEVTATAERHFMSRTGLTAVFVVRGGGYIRINHGGELESFTHFTMVESTHAEGDLLERTRSGANLWISDPDFSANDMIPSMPALTAALVKPGLFFSI